MHTPSAPQSSSGGGGPAPRAARSLGPWTLRVAEDELSQITYRGAMLVETLRPALRDADWGTIAPRILADTWEETPDALHRTLDVSYPLPGGEVRARSELTLTPTELRLRYEAKPEVEIRTNRVGLTVMLPRTMAGEDLVVRTPEGRRRDARLPVQVAPFQPLFDIASLDLDHEGVRARLELTGDVFEMEDQRNWCDASFKIYSRPLADPFPYTVAAGESVVQEAVLRILPGSDADPADASETAGTVPAVADLAELLERTVPCELPRVSIGATTSFADAVGEGVEAPGARALAGLPGLDALTVEVADGFPAARILRAAAAEARTLGVGVDLRLIVRSDADAGASGTVSATIARLLDEADAAGLPLQRVGIVDAAGHVTTVPLLDALRAELARRAPADAIGTETLDAGASAPDPAAPAGSPSAPDADASAPGVSTPRSAAPFGAPIDLVAGARTHFTELNREIHAIPTDADLLAFAHTPQMHQREDWHVAETLATLHDVIASARTLRPEARLALGPVTLRPRVNGVATDPAVVDRADETGYGAHRTPEATDPRQGTERAGAWALCVLLAAAEEGIEHVSIAELSGPRGLLAPDGSLRPMGETVHEIASGTRKVRVLTDVAGSGTALALHGEHLLLANAREDVWRIAVGPAGAIGTGGPDGARGAVGSDGPDGPDGTIDPVGLAGTIGPDDVIEVAPGSVRVLAW